MDGNNNYMKFILIAEIGGSSPTWGSERHVLESHEKENDHSAYPKMIGRTMAQMIRHLTYPGNAYGMAPILNALCDELLNLDGLDDREIELYYELSKAIRRADIFFNKLPPEDNSDYDRLIIPLLEYIRSWEPKK